MMNAYNDYNVPWIIGSLVFCWGSIFVLIRTILGEFSVVISPFFGALMAHSASFLSTSLIEEEHQTFYFLWPTMIFILFWRYAKKSFFANFLIPKFFLVLLLHRLGREWNRTGDKWKHLEDVGDILAKFVRPKFNTCVQKLIVRSKYFRFRPENIYILTVLSFVSAALGTILISKRLKTNLSKLTFCLGMIFVAWYRYQSDWNQFQYGHLGNLFEPKNDYLDIFQSHLGSEMRLFYGCIVNFTSQK